MGKEVVTLKDLRIGDRFILATQYTKRTPTWKVLGKSEFNAGHGRPTRECCNEVTRKRESKSCRLKVIKLNQKEDKQ
jgi:hypothetical protein